MKGEAVRFHVHQLLLNIRCRDIYFPDRDNAIANLSILHLTVKMKRLEKCLETGGTRTTAVLLWQFNLYQFSW